MSQAVVVDTDIASYIFNWHTLAQHNVDALRAFGISACFALKAGSRSSAASYFVTPCFPFFLRVALARTKAP